MSFRDKFDLVFIGACLLIALDMVVHGIADDQRPHWAWGAYGCVMCALEAFWARRAEKRANADREGE